MNPEITPRRDYLAEARKTIEEEKYCWFITDIAGLMGVTRQTLINHGVNEDPEVLRLLHLNKVRNVLAQRKNWAMQSDIVGLQVALYKIATTDDERRKLSTSHTDITTKGERLNNDEIDYTKLSDEVLEELDKARIRHDDKEAEG